MTVQAISDKVILAKYNVGRLLGSGAYGEVFKASCKSTQKEVAIKRCFDAFRNSSDAQKMYRELCILLELRGNPLFAQLTDVFRAEGDKDLFCVFDRMESDLHRGLSALTGTVIHRRYIMYQIVTAVSYLHAAQIVHRDLKPSNVLINWDDCQIRLCDFGLARSIGYLGSSDASDSLTTYVATRWYRAPELIFGSCVYDGAVDVWALGCIMGEMIRGKPMFTSNSTLEQLERVLELTGLPPDKDLSHLQTSETAKELLVQIHNKGHKKVRDLADMLGFGSTNDEIDFVAKCLEFHPRKRATVDQLLNHVYFAPIRKIEFERKPAKPIRIPLDQSKSPNTETFKSAIFSLVAQLEEECKIPPPLITSETLATTKKMDSPQISDGKKPYDACLETYLLNESIESSSTKKGGCLSVNQAVHARILARTPSTAAEIRTAKTLLNSSLPPRNRRREGLCKPPVPRRTPSVTKPVVEVYKRTPSVPRRAPTVKPVVEVYRRTPSTPQSGLFRRTVSKSNFETPIRQGTPLRRESSNKPDLTRCGSRTTLTMKPVAPVMLASKKSTIFYQNKPKAAIPPLKFHLLEAYRGY